MSSATTIRAGTPSRWRADLALALVAMVWGSTFVMVKDALADVSPVLFLGLRFSAASAVLTILYVTKSRPAVPRGGWIGGVVTGGLLFVGFLFQTFGLRLTTPAKSGFITGLYIVLVPLAAAIVYKKAPQLSELLGVVI